MPEDDEDTDDPDEEVASTALMSVISPVDFLGVIPLAYRSNYLINNNFFQFSS